ncbi:MAG: hypothetical protein WCK13_01885 [Ignavibacteriota bacterium]
MMKTIIISFLTMMSALLMISCSENTVSPTGTTANGYISDKVENWTLGNQTINASICIPGSYSYADLGTGQINSAGIFSIGFTTPASEYLTGIDNLFNEGTEVHVKVNSLNTKYAILVLTVKDTSGNVTGLIERRNYTDNITDNSFFTEYIYFNDDITLTGTKLNGYAADTTFSEYNVNSKTGWSTLSCMFTKFTPTYISYKISNTEPQGAKWYYFDVNDKSTGVNFRHKHPALFK